MGRIVVPVSIMNVYEPDYRIVCDALVDTGASYLVLPARWKERLGKLERIDTIEVEMADQSSIQGEIYGPVKLQIEGFRPIFTEVLFIDMNPSEGPPEPLLGYIVLEQSQAAVDMMGHRLIPIKRMDLK